MLIIYKLEMLISGLFETSLDILIQSVYFNTYYI